MVSYIIQTLVNNMTANCLKASIVYKSLGLLLLCLRLFVQLNTKLQDATIEARKYIRLSSQLVQKTTVKINWFIVCWKLSICTIKVFKVAKTFHNQLVPAIL